MSTLQPENIVEGMFDALNARDYARAAGAIAEHCEWHSVATESVHRGPGAIVAGLREFVAAFPDWRADVKSVIASGERVVIEWDSTGTFRNPFRGKPANGKSFRRRGRSVAEVEGGKIVRYRDYYDRATLLQQLDMLDLL
ncbi:MAG: ester cyclase [Usitatibacter sp.]